MLDSRCTLHGALGALMTVHYDYFVSGDGIPGDDVVDTRWVDPALHVGRLYARLTNQPWSPALVQLVRLEHLPAMDDAEDSETPGLERVPDEVRDALADVPPERLQSLGTWWASTDELVRDEVPADEVTALLHDLVALCVTGRDSGQGLFVARTYRVT